MPARPAAHRASLYDLPLFLLLIGVASIAMLVPAVFAGVTRELATGRSFLYSGLLGLIGFGMIALAERGPPTRRDK